MRWTKGFHTHIRMNRLCNMAGVSDPAFLWADISLYAISLGVHMKVFKEIDSYEALQNYKGLVLTIKPERQQGFFPQQSNTSTSNINL